MYVYIRIYVWNSDDRAGKIYIIELLKFRLIWLNNSDLSW